METLKDLYKERFNRFNGELKKLSAKNRVVSSLRLIIFLSTIVISYFISDYGIYAILLTVVLALIPFLFLVKVNVRNEQKINHLKALVEINKNETEGLKGNISVFRTGKEYIDYGHAFSYDLDIFGEASIYQSMNRTCTKGGADALATSFKNLLQDKQKIEEQQQAVNELSGKINWRQDFQATGNTVLESNEVPESSSSWFSRNNSSFKNDNSFHEEILAWANSGFEFISIKVLPVLLILLPALALILLTLTTLGMFPVMGFIVYGLAMLSYVGFYTKKITFIHGRIGRKVNILDKYGKLLKLIEKEDYNSKFLLSLLNKTSVDKHTASEELNRLKNLVKALDNRMNILFALFANALLLWDLQVVYRLEKWRQKNQESMPEWFETIYRFDELSSKATFAFNHPKYIVPQIVEGNFSLKIKQGGHPLLDEKERVDNDFEMYGHAQIRIITGANMAGKSTFLRTIGVNLVLAMSGNVVCAKEFAFVPIPIHTSVRTNDSLQKSESYFFAELKRLKTIIDRLKTGEKLFVIVDEMLRGTNSKDKHLGSEALTKQMIDLKASGLIATHDIALGELTEKYPENIQNQRFEVETENDKLVFDYLLKPGISQNLNAVFLMKKMGVIPQSE
jgi:DNA mismatch repair ATPase MutS